MTRIALLFALLTVACETPPPAPDAGGFDDAGPPPSTEGPSFAWLEAGEAPVAPPAIPWLDDGAPPVAPPRVDACVSGWRSLTTPAGVAYCDPRPEVAPPPCAFGEALAVGADACAPIGEACGTDAFSARALPAGAEVWYVHGDAPTLGDGTGRDGPLATIGEALALASPGAVILVGPGEYPESIALDTPVELIGACLSGTLLTGTPGGSDPVVRAQSVGVALRDLAIRAPGRVALEVTATGDAELEALMLEEVAVGLRVDGGRVSAAQLVVRGASGVGIDVASGGTLAGTAVAVSGSGGAGLRVAAAEALFDASHFTANGAGEGGAPGLIADDGSTLTLDASLVEAGDVAGVRVAGADTLLTVTDTFVANDRSVGFPERFPALEALDGAQLDARRVTLADNPIGIRVRDGSAALEDVLVLGRAEVPGTVTPASDGLWLERATATWRRGVVERGTSPALALVESTLEAEDLDLHVPGIGVGILAIGLDEGSSLTLERARIAGYNDVAVRIRASRLAVTDVLFANAVELFQPVAIRYVDGAEIVLERALFSRTGGALVGDEPPGGARSTVILRDAVIRHRGASTVALGGIGIWSQDTDLTLERALFEGGLGHAIYALRTVANLSDVRIRDLSNWSTLFRGAGAVFLDRTTATLERVDVEGAEVAGLIATGPETSMHLEDVSVRGTTGTELEGELGVGIWAEERATVTGERVVLADNRQVGLLSDTQADVQLDELAIRRTLTASCAEACPDRARGFGVLAMNRANVRSSRFEISESASCGALVGQNGGVDLLGGVISSTPTGACLQQEEYGVSRVTRAVRFEEVDTMVETTTYLLPSLTEATPEPL